MKTLNAVFTFVKDNIYLAIFGVVLAFAFFYTGHFAELLYAAIRMMAVVIVAALVLHWKFPDTLHKYINEDGLINDFRGLDPKHRVLATLAILAVLFVVSALCFSNP